MGKSRPRTCIVLQAIAQPEAAVLREALPADPSAVQPSSRAPTDFEYDAVIIGSGIGGLTTATQMAAKGAKVVVLEKCAPPMAYTHPPTHELPIRARMYGLRLRIHACAALPACAK